jgi:AraC-like DNA-binding protein
MEPIPIVRAAHLIPYLYLLRGIGAPVETALCRAKLPTMLVDQADAQVPLLQSIDFLTKIVLSEGIDDLALRTRERSNIKDLHPVFLSSICSAPTLKTALETVFRLVSLENNYLDLWMLSDASEARICSRYRIPFDAQQTRLLELDINVVLVGIVRAFVGPRWCPEEMAFQSTLPLGRYVSEQFPNTRFLFGQKTAWFDLPRAMLSLPPRIKSNAASSPSTLTPIVETARDFPATLKRVLKSYLADGYPTIQLAAEIAGTSPRTLQRWLREYNLSYSKLVHQIRFESAVELLKDPHIHTLDVAYAVGYGDPSNFSRAFRQIAGVSPKEYRRQHLIRERNHTEGAQEMI